MNIIISGRTWRSLILCGRKSTEGWQAKRYFKPGTEAQVTLSVEKPTHSGGYNSFQRCFNSGGKSTDNMYGSIDRVLDNWSTRS